MPRLIDVILAVLAAALLIASFVLESRGMVHETQIVRWAAFVVLFIAATVRLRDRLR